MRLEINETVERQNINVPVSDPAGRSDCHADFYRSLRTGNPAGNKRESCGDGNGERRGYKRNIEI